MEADMKKPGKLTDSNEWPWPLPVVGMLTWNEESAKNKGDGLYGWQNSIYEACLM